MRRATRRLLKRLKISQKVVDKLYQSARITTTRSKTLLTDEETTKMTTLAQACKAILTDAIDHDYLADCEATLKEVYMSEYGCVSCPLQQLFRTTQESDLLSQQRWFSVELTGMPNYPDMALKEATHTDDVGYLYRVMGEEPRAFCVDYWNLRLNQWCQDMGGSFPYLVKIENKSK